MGIKPSLKLSSRIKGCLLVDKIFSMNGRDGGGGSSGYAQNSTLQRKTREMVDHVTIDTLLDFWIRTSPKCLKIADLGCSSGPNVTSWIRKIVWKINEKKHDGLMEIQVFLNDLPTNDFNSIFMELPSFIHNLSKSTTAGFSPPVFVAGVPGSFYGRLFPTSSLHFVHSSCSLHWLSQVPPGLFDDHGNALYEGKDMTIYINGETSPPFVLEAYLDQFQRDFSVFLRSRSEEMVDGGRMVLIMLGRRTDDHSDKGETLLWDLLSETLNLMVSKREVEEHKARSYKANFYAPSMMEIESLVQREGSFVIDKLEMFDRGGDDDENAKMDGDVVAKAVRAIQEPTMLRHFGQGVCDRFFQLYREILNKRFDTPEEFEVAVSLVMVLRKSVSS